MPTLYRELRSSSVAAYLSFIVNAANSRMEGRVKFKYYMQASHNKLTDSAIFTLNGKVTKYIKFRDKLHHNS